jgi:pectin methylesterase-like acyl-CoA thioesterase
MLTRSYLMLATVLVLLATPAPASQTWIVAQDGSGDFTEVQPAIDAAQDGDLILVKPGVYLKQGDPGRGKRDP